MNRIERKLQNVTWSYDFDKNELTLFTKTEAFTIGKAHTYSLGRFLVRVWQKLASRKRRVSEKKVEDTTQIVKASLAKPQ